MGILDFFRKPRELEPFDFKNNPYRARKQWPPDFSKLTAKEQFRFERKFKRRNKLAWARPRWTMATKLVQWGLIVGFTGYMVLFSRWDKKDDEPEPFEDLRKVVRKMADGLWTLSGTTLSAQEARRFRERPREETEKVQEKARE